MREPRRSAFGVLYELLGDRSASRNKLPVGAPLAGALACTPEEAGVWTAIIKRGVNAPMTSSAGRLFDAMASILGICHNSSFEGQAAMQLEYAIGDVETDERYGFKVIQDRSDGEDALMVVDWASMVYEIMLDTCLETPLARIAARIHNTLSEMIVDVARLVGAPQVVLTGGCFQNAYLIERTVRRLQEEGFKPYWHQRVPPNDGGIALGQIVAANWSPQEE